MMPRLSNQQYVLFLSGAAAFVLGATGILGLFFGIVPLSSVFVTYRPIALSAALIWSFFGLVLILCCRRPISGVVKIVLGAVTACIAVDVAIEFPLGILGRHSFIEAFLNSSASHFFQTTLVPISPLAALMMLPAAIGIFLLIIKEEYPHENRREHTLVGIFGIFCLLFGFLFIAGYLYRAPLFYDTSILPIAFTSALAGLFVGIGLIAAAGSAAFPLVYFSGPSVRARLFRFFVPFMITLVIIQSLLSVILISIFHVQQAIELALVLVLFCIIAAWGIHIISGIIGDTLDSEKELRRQAEEELQKKHEDLNMAYEQVTATEEELRQNYEELNTTYERLTATEEELRGNYEELARNQERLQKSEQMFRTLADFTYDWEYWIDQNGAVVYTSPSCEQITGYSVGDFMEGPGLITRIVHPDDLPLFVEHQKLVHDCPQPGELEFRILCRDGAIRWIGHTCRPITGSSGQFLGTRVSNRDITWRKDAERELRETNLRLTEVQELARLGFWTWDVRTGDVEWSDEVFKIFGLSPSTFKPRIDSILALSPWPEEQQRGRELIQRATESHAPGTYEQRFLRPDGSPGYYYSTFEGRYDPEGHLTSIVGTVLDITGRKKAEEAFRESQAKLAVALASLTDAVFISDADGNFLEFNDAFATFHRFKDKAECAKTLKEYPGFLEVYMADGTPAPLEMWAVPRALRGETGTNVEYSLKRKDTGETWVGSYSFAPLRDQQGRITGSVVSGRDITAQKQAEKELREKHNELRAAYEQLTATEEELRANYDELEKSGQKLRAGEQRLRRFYDAGLIGVILWNTSGKITDANDKFLSMTGYSREDLIAGRVSWDDMTPHEFYHLDEQALAELKETGINRVPYEKEYFRKDGSRLPILLACAMLDDHFFEGVAFVLDISARKSAEAALRASEERYKSLFENMQEGLAYCRMIYDDNGGPADFVYLAVNRAFEQIIGEGTVTGRPVTEVFPGIREAFPQLFEIYGRVARTGSPEAFELYFTPSKKWLHLSVYSPAREEFVAVFSDISARKSAEAEKERLAGQRQLALNAANLGWWHYDPVSKISTWDERYAEIFGVSGLTRPNEEVLKLLDPADLPRVWAAVEAALDPADPRPYSIEYRVNRPDGEVRWVRANGVAAFEGTGAARQATSFVGTVEDITRRRRAEQQRELLIKDLEEKNAELERFTYTVSHDLKSPLITIRGFAGLLEEDLKSNEADKIARDLDRIMAATEKMEALLKDLLNLSRIGRIVNPPESVSFTQIAKESVELLDSAIRNRGITIKIDPNMPEVNVDRVRVREALTNLIENAIKFMGDQPGPEICIGKTDGGDGPVFFVRDNGIGIEAKYHERIFTLFEKLDAHKDGSGAGLAIVKRIIEVHGGRIWVESAGPGTGSTFFFTLPVTDHGMTGTHNMEKKGV